MKIQTFWLNLPVRDMAKAKAFYRGIGFTENPMHEGSLEVGSFFLGEQNTILMLFPEPVFTSFSHNGLINTEKGTEVLLNIDAQTRDEVDAMAKLALEAGGSIYSEPGEAQGWMYACGFSDPDGHRWCTLHMDLGKMPKR